MTQSPSPSPEADAPLGETRIVARAVGANALASQQRSRPSGNEQIFFKVPGAPRFSNPLTPTRQALLGMPIPFRDALAPQIGSARAAHLVSDEAPADAAGTEKLSRMVVGHRYAPHVPDCN